MGAHRIMRSLLVIGTLLAVMAVSTFAEEKALEDDPVKEGERELAKMDTNKDGVADLSEVIAHMKKEFYKPEDNEKNKISPEQADTKSTADGKEYLEVLDANKDGKVTKDEFIKHFTHDTAETDAELDEATDADEDPDADPVDPDADE